jgi:hypothetical protein
MLTLRKQVIDRIGETTWSAFITDHNENTRIISVRRARADEEARYLADAGTARVRLDEMHDAGENLSRAVVAGN